MSELKRPDPMNPEGFCQLVVEEMTKQDITFPMTEIGRYLGIAPATLKLIFDQTFPGKPKNKKKPAGPKFIQGRVESVVSVCTKLGLDVSACLEACGLPNNMRVIERRRQQIAKKSRPLDGLDKLELEMLLTQVDIFGPLPWELTIELVKRFRANKKEE